MNHAPMTSGQLARAAAVNVETLRFYERHGLLPEPDRTASGHRRYGPDALEQLQLIKRAQLLTPVPPRFVSEESPSSPFTSRFRS
jgi:hypothetical protein